MTYGLRAGFDYVQARAAAGVYLAVRGLQLDGHFAQRVGAAGDGLDDEIHQLVLRVHHLIDGLVDRVDRADPDPRLDDLAALGLQPDRGGRDAVETAHHVHIRKFVLRRDRIRLVRDDRFQVLVEDLLLLVGGLLEARERLVQLRLAQMIAQRLQLVLERVPAGMLAQDQLALGQTNGLRVHDLIRAFVLQHAVLMDAGLVRERVAAHDGLVDLHRQAR